MSEAFTIEIYTKSSELPEMSSRSFFHSAELFYILEQSRGQQPFMVVAWQAGHVVAHLLAMLRRRGAWIPPYLFTQGRIYGEGEYEENIDREMVFGLMLNAITKRLQRKMCFFIEVSDLTQKMFGYKSLRRHGYFPIHWSAIHNSLHSKAPVDRLSDKMKERIEKVSSNALTFHELSEQTELKSFYRLFHRFFSMKIQRYLPPEEQFRLMMGSRHCRFFVVKLQDKVVGGCTCVYSQKDANLWMVASKRKSHPTLHPETRIVWEVMNLAYQEGYEHFRFLHVGLPFSKNPMRDFILRFGGKEMSTYRWFRFSFSWINALAGWFFKD